MVRPEYKHLEETLTPMVGNIFIAEKSFGFPMNYVKLNEIFCIQWRYFFTCRQSFLCNLCIFFIQFVFYIETIIFNNIVYHSFKFH